MATSRFPRILGRHRGTVPGPTLVVCAGLHGNEPAGVLAAQRVSAALDNLTLPLRGEWMAIVGNVAALNADRRFLVQDLNRCWSEPEVRAMLARDPAEDSPEQAEQRELVEIFGEAAERSRGQLIVLDLHTTSAESPPFLVLSDTLANRSIAAGLPGTVILGLEEAVDGTLLDYMSQLGHRGVVIESGQHREEKAILFHESFIWLAFAAAGLLDERDVPGYHEHAHSLREACRTAPRVVEVRHRHPVEDDDGFVMRPGFRSFQKVEQGDMIADDRSGPVRTPRAGMLLMPLYQELGSDGFFVVRPVKPFWLRVSRALRRLRLHVLLPLLPGVSKDRDRRGTLRVDPKVARLYTVEIFHLFGYRKRRSDGDMLRFSRRT
ncbi:MAG: succinylglutamate desuccinylase/aspartoacylase family protein [Planctomycetota bacterium]|jgi:succinylglutamate desuccinylase